MLVLARKKGQSIIVNDDIEIMIIDIQKDVVRLGIKAPKTVPVFRREIYDEIVEENKKASEFKKISISELIRKKTD